MTMDRGPGWLAVHEELTRRIREREWQPGDQVPGEADLAVELGCSRSTVNRAMRELAAAGLLDRRRKAGTRVAEYPVSRARLAVPVIRLEVEARGARWSHVLLERKLAKPPVSIRGRMNLSGSDALLLRGVHFADGSPLIFETRWIGTEAVPAALEVDFDTISANEWLVRNAPFTHGDMAFFAEAAQDEEAECLGIEPGSPIFLAERLTWNGDRAITWVRLCHAPGYRMHASL